MYKILNKLIAITVLLLLLGSAQAQDTQRRAYNPSGGAWLTSGSNATFFSIGQPGVSSDMTSEDGVWSGTIGFVFPEVAIGKNNAPVAITNEFPVFIADSLVELQGYDPDNDPITFEIVTNPTLGTIALDEGKFFRFTPSPGLNPGQLYDDALTFKVNDGNKDSEVATWSFQFILEDVPHQISGLNFGNDVLSLSWTDLVPNTNYEVLIEYYDLTDPVNPLFRTVTDQSYLAADVEIVAGEFDLALSVSDTEHPYLLNGNQVLVATSVITPNGVGSFELFVIDNTSGGRVAASEDGQFFAFGGDQTVRENGSVELSLYGVELGDFDISTSVVEVISEGLKGILGTPSVKETDEYIKEWTAIYESVEEIGGLDSIQFRVFNQDRQLFDTAWVRVDIVDVNDPPTLEAIAEQVTLEDTPLEVLISPFDPDNEVSVLVQSSETTLVPVIYSDGVITISPSNDYAGIASISVIVQEIGTDEGYVAFQRFNVEVLNVDDSPKVAAIPDATVDEDNSLTVIASASDVDAPLAVFTYTVEISDPSAFDVTINGNNITLTPVANIFGTYEVKVFADDGLGKETSVSEAEIFQLTVNAVNDAPEILKAFATQQIVDGLPDYTINLGAYFADVEDGADLIYTFTGNTDIGLSIDEAILSVSPGDGFNTVEDVTITASDGDLSIEQIISFVYVAVSADISVAQEIATIQRNEDEDNGVFTLDVSSTFVDLNDANAEFEYTLSEGAFIETSIDEQGVIIFTVDENYFGNETFFLFGSVGNQVNFTSFDVEIIAVNDAPVISDIESKSVNEDQVLSGLFVPVSDVDNDISDITLLFSSSDEGIVSASAITHSSLENGFLLNISPVLNANGEVNITIIANDGSRDDEVVVPLTVVPINDQPQRVTTALADATEDVAYSLDLEALFTDADGDQLQYAVNEKPDWLLLSNTILEGIPANEDVGSSNLVVRADDGNGGIIVESFELEIVNVNDAPELSSELADLSLLEDVGEVVIDLSDVFLDPDGDELIYAVVSSNESVATASVADHSLTLTEVANGSSTITVEADDQKGGKVEIAFLVTIVNVNDAPEVALQTQNQVLDEGFSTATIELDGAFSDDDGDAITIDAFVADEQVVTVSITGTNLILSEVGIGTTTITVKGVDGNGGEASFDFEVTVNEVLGEFSKDNLQIYPNPTTNWLFVKGNYEQIRWSIIDISGRILLTGKNGGERIDVSSLQAGIYHFVVHDSDDHFKIIIR